MIPPDPISSTLLKQQACKKYQRGHYHEETAGEWRRLAVKNEPRHIRTRYNGVRSSPPAYSLIGTYEVLILNNAATCCCGLLSVLTEATTGSSAGFELTEGS